MSDPDGTRRYDPYPGQYGYPPPERKRSKAPVILAVLVTLLVVAVAILTFLLVTVEPTETTDEGTG